MASKKYRVEWSERASLDLFEATAFVRQRNPGASKRLYEQLIRKTRLLETHPKLGRIVPEYGDELRRELIYTPYRIIYQVFQPSERSKYWRSCTAPGCWYSKRIGTRGQTSMLLTSRVQYTYAEQSSPRGFDLR